MILRTHVAAAALASALIIASCGSDEASNEVDSATEATATDVETTATTASSEATDPAAPAQDIEADTAAAQAALLALGDFPAGWSETPPDEDDGDPEADRALAECAGVDGDKLIDTDAEAETGRFSDPDGESFVDQAVGLMPTEDEAAAPFASFTSTDVIACFADVYNELFASSLEDGDLPDNAEIGEITVARLNVTPVGDDTAAIRISVPISVTGITVDVTVDLVLTRVGRSLSGLSFQSTFGPINIEILDQYNDLAASRLPG